LNYFRLAGPRAIYLATALAAPRLTGLTMVYASVPDMVNPVNKVNPVIPTPETAKIIIQLASTS
jgi:hypothetical protein